MHRNRIIDLLDFPCELSTTWKSFLILIFLICNTCAIINRSWILTVHKSRILRQKLLKKKILTFKNGVINIQTAGYNGAPSVYWKIQKSLVPSIWSQRTFMKLSLNFSFIKSTVNFWITFLLSWCNVDGAKLFNNLDLGSPRLTSKPMSHI